MYEELLKKLDEFSRQFNNLADLADGRLKDLPDVPATAIPPELDNHVGIAKAATLRDLSIVFAEGDEYVQREVMVALSTISALLKVKKAARKQYELLVTKAKVINSNPLLN